jgi:hypothetical protein
MRMTTSLWLALCAAFLLALTCIGLALPNPAPGQFGIGYGAALHWFVFVACAQGVIYFGAVALILRHPGQKLWPILAVAFLLRATVLVFPPFLSNDIYRYIWDGWVQAAGINPYRYIPDDPHLAFLRDTAVFPHINRAAYAPTIYPPAAQMVFFCAANLGRLAELPPVFAMKLAMVLLEATGIWATLRLLDQAGLPRQRILIYAWNPLPIWEFAGSGHVDALAICFIALALLAAGTARGLRSAILLAAAVLTKFLPAVLLPALWQRRDRRFAAAFGLTILLLYLPYLGAGAKVLGFLGGYGQQEGIDSGHGIVLLAALSRLIPLPAFAPAGYLALLAAVLLAIGWWMLTHPLPPPGPARTQTIARRSLLLGGVLLAGISPHYPWYYAWLLVPACLLPAPSALYLATASFLLYLNPTHAKLLWPTLLYAPFAALAFTDLWRHRTRTN